MNNICRAVFAILVASNIGSVRSAELTGIVQDESGVVIEGAIVDISTAAPIKGPSLFCPSCYLDCSKWTKTDANGRYSISSLDESLKFRLVVTAPGKKTYRTELTEPRQSPIVISLQQMPDDLPASRILRGRVIDGFDVPISGALIEPVGAQTANRSWGGRVNAWTSVTNDHGDFAMILEEDYLGVDIEVTAHGFPGAKKLKLAPGEKSHEVVLNSGCKVFGRLLKLGRSNLLSNVAAVQLDRGNFDRLFINAVLAEVSDDGYFEFPPLPPDEYYAIFSLADQQSSDRRVIQTALFLCGADGESLDLGVIHAVSSYSIHGKLLMQNAVLPDGIFVSLKREPAWDLVKVAVEADGSFVLNNLPREAYEVVINTQALEIDFSKFSYQPMSRNSFGIYSFDRSAIEIPLRNLSTAEASNPKRTVAGRVVSRKGTPIQGVTIVPEAFAINKKLANSIKSGSDGSFEFSSLPSEPFELFFYNHQRYKYPRSKSQSRGNTILFPGKLTVYLDQSDLHIIYDIELETGFPLIEGTTRK